MNGNYKTTAEPSRRRRVLRWVIGSIALILILFLLFLLAVPTILSSRSGKEGLVKQINENIRGRVTIGRLKLSWFGKQEIRDLTIKTPKGDSIAALDSLTTDATLWEILGGGRDFGNAVMRGLRADIVADENGRTNLLDALEPREQAQKQRENRPEVPRTLRVDFTLKDSTIRYSAPNSEPAVLRDFAGHIKVPHIEGPIRFNFKGQTEQGTLSGNLESEGEIRDLFNSDGKLTPERAKANVDAAATNLPTVGLEPLLRKHGLLVAALGTHLNLTMHSETTGSEGRATVTIDSQNLKAQTLLEKRRNIVSLVRPATIDFTFTPDLARYLSDEYSNGRRVEIERPTPISLTLDSLRLPLEQNQLGQMSLLGTMKSGDWRFTGDPAIEGVSISSLVASIQTASLADSLDVSINGVLSREDNNNPFNAQISLTDLVNRSGQLEPARMKAAIQAEAREVPVELADRLLGQQGLLTAALGPSLNISARTQTGQAPLTTNILLDSQRLNASIPLVFDQGISFARGAQADWQLTPEALRRILGPKQTMALLRTVPLHIAIDEFSLPRNDRNGGFDWQQMRLSGVAKPSEEVALQNAPQATNAVIDNLVISAQGDSLSSIAITAQGKMLFPENSRGILPAVFTEPAETEAQIMGIFASPRDTVPFSVKMDGPTFDGALEGQILPNTIELTKPATIQTEITSALLRELSGNRPDVPTLTEPAPVTLNLQQLSIPRGAMQFENVVLVLTASLQRITLDGAARFSGASLSNTEIEASINGEKDRAELHIKGETLAPGSSQPGTLSADVTLSDLLHNGMILLPQSSVQASVEADQLSAALVEALTGTAGKIVPWTGPTLQTRLNVDVRSAQQRQGTAEIQARGDNLFIDAGLRIEDELTLTPRA